MTTEELAVHVDRELESLCAEFAGTVPAGLVTEIGRNRYEALRATATIYDFIPLLVFRETREELLHTCRRSELHRSA